MPPYTNPSTHTEHSRALGYGWIQEGTEQNQKPERAGWKLDVVLAGFLFLFFFFCRFLSIFAQGRDNGVWGASG